MLQEKAAEAWQQHGLSTIDLEDLREATNPAVLAEWDSVDDTPRRGPGGIVESVYRMPKVDGMQSS